jgi:hypothetical protein
VALDSSLPTADFIDEVDTRQCRFTMKVVRFTLAGAVWSRGRKREACGGFPVEAERENEGETWPVWARHVEKKKMGAPAMHTLERGGGDPGSRQQCGSGGRGRWRGS